MKSSSLRLIASSSSQKPALGLTEEVYEVEKIIDRFSLTGSLGFVPLLALRHDASV
jgi:hypothetical protein